MLCWAFGSCLVLVRKYSEKRRVVDVSKALSWSLHQPSISSQYVCSSVKFYSPVVSPSPSITFTVWDIFPWELHPIKHHEHRTRLEISSSTKVKNDCELIAQMRILIWRRMTCYVHNSDSVLLWQQRVWQLSYHFD